MNPKQIIFLFLFSIASLFSNTQSLHQRQPASADTVLVNSLLQQSKDNIKEDPAKAISLSEEAKKMALQINFPQGAAYALKNIGQVYKKQGKYLEALDNYRQSIKIFESIKDDVGISNLYNNIGNVYYDQSDDVKALENYLQSLKYAEKSGDKLRMLSALNNVGGVYTNKSATYDRALYYYLKALPLCEEIGKKDELGAICVNIGFIYAEKNDPDKAMIYFNKSLNAYGNSEGGLNAYNAIGKLYNNQGKYELALMNHNKALTLAEKLNVNILIAKSLYGLGNVYEKKGNYQEAIKYYKKAEIPAIEAEATLELKEIYEKISAAYAKTGEYANAFKYHTLYANSKDTLYNIDNDKKLGSLQFDFDLQKKQGEINLLTKDKDLTDLQLKRQQFAKRVLIGGVGLMLLIAALIYRSYRIKAKTSRILDRQKGEIESLLLNILPAEVARELQVKGYATPRNYDSVAVMFTDFKGFTTIADKMSPQELIEELNTNFIAFDEIMEKYSLEKIKTIGDSYMCAGGIPTPDNHYVENIIKASLEIKDFAFEYNEKRKANGLEPWELRIGIHIGPVVAGVVGKKKYAYDIWGSTVNIASRMESNGVPGRVNISSFTYDLIKDKYECSYRGKIHAKNIGDIDMYLVDEEKHDSAVVKTFKKDIAASTVL